MGLSERLVVIELVVRASWVLQIHITGFYVGLELELLGLHWVLLWVGYKQRKHSLYQLSNQDNTGS